jgi:FAD/FMN-containing dehydrogenase
MDRLLNFDSSSGILTCEAGVSLAEILRVFVPRGWFVPVTPGTKFVTVGGAIANDVHGKNHHVMGTFGRHVLNLELLRSDGTRIRCSPSENPEWYAATIGGMGLTGLITSATLQLIRVAGRNIDCHKVKFHGLEEFMELSQEFAGTTYNVAWIDCVSPGHDVRGIFIAGNHCQQPMPGTPRGARKLAVPFDFPGWVLSRTGVRAFNELYFRKQIKNREHDTVDVEPFFYPLDSILQWNRLYGRHGLLQFQCCVPFSEGLKTVSQMLDRIRESGLASFLAVLKVCGDIVSPGMMSFPKPGITLALDFPLRGRTFELIDRLGQMTAEAGGRLYPAKDARMTPSQFRLFYPNLSTFVRYLDPQISSSFWRRVMPA